MNERLQELINKANVGLDGVAPGMLPMDDPSYDVFVRRFAELIIGQCTEVATSISTLYPREDIGFDVGYTMSAKRVATEINKHFGITE